MSPEVLEEDMSRSKQTRERLVHEACQAWQPPAALAYEFWRAPSLRTWDTSFSFISVKIHGFTKAPENGWA